MDTAIIRLEAICPFPLEELSDSLGNFSNVKGKFNSFYLLQSLEYIWSQEEPRNAGCWNFVNPRFINGLGLTVSHSEFHKIS